jgi:hypothetical protein
VETRSAPEIRGQQIPTRTIVQVLEEQDLHSNWNIKNRPIRRFFALNELWIA